jgi:hypothetical protein
MIYLVMTATGLVQALRVAGAEDAIWCGSDAITEEAYKALGDANVTRFTHAIADQHQIEDALATIADHHPGQTVWVEGSTAP